MNWSKRFVEHSQDGISRLSVVFTWDLPDAYQRAVWLRAQGQRVVAGGPAVMLMPDYLADVAEIGTDWPDAVARHNPHATFTSRGCIRRCSFCAVWRTEGELRELDDWPVRPIVCDNNLLACSRRHFDRVIDRLKPLSGIDFNQGLDARLLTDYHASRLAELDCKVRLAFDHVKTEPQFRAAFDLLTRAGIPSHNIRVYVLLGYQDTPEDALYRLQIVASLGAMPNPMRYQPLTTLTRNGYIDPNWTKRQLTDMSRYWFRSEFFQRMGIQWEDYMR